MGLAKIINRLKYIDYLIRKRATGDLSSFSKRNGLSKSTLSEILNQMKEMGFPIAYDRSRKTYYYHENGQMIPTLFLKYNEVVQKSELSILTNDDLCFSPSAIFEPCKE